MIREEDYYEWLCSKINDADFNTSHYTKLLQRLYISEFTWSVEEDENRAVDGLCLRTDFASESGVDPFDVKLVIGHPCSILEMMVALACRCENQIMEDLFVGPRFGRWFRVMITSLGLRYETDEYYDENYVDYILTSFLNREYNEDGDGGLFRIRESNVDMRQMEIWYQMNVYLRELLQVG